MARVAKDIAIIGGGPAGMACSARLSQLKFMGRFPGEHKVYDAAAALGGKCSVYTTNEHYFDYGVQRFSKPTTRPWDTATRSLRQLRMLSAWRTKEYNYDHNTRERREVPKRKEDKSLVLAPSNRVLVKTIWQNYHASGDTDCLRVNSTVVKIQRWERDQWVFQSQQQAKWARADILVLACPPQAILPAFAGSEEFPLPESSVVAQCARVGHYPVAVLLIGWHVPHMVDFDVMHVANHPTIARVYNNNSKDGRPTDVTSLSVVSTPEFGARALHMRSEELVYAMGTALQELEAFSSLTRPPNFTASHFWQHAVHNNDTPFTTLWDPQAAIGVCGDWTQGANNIEAAWTSGVRLANAIAGCEDLDEFEEVNSRNLKTAGIYTDEIRPPKPFFNPQRNRDVA